MNRTVRLVLLTLLTLLPGTVFFAQAPKSTSNDPSIGTWVFNAQKSKLPGPAPNTFIERYDLRPDGFIVGTRAIVGNDGSPGFEQAVFKYDGKDYEWWDAPSMADFLAAHKRTPKTLSFKTAPDAYVVEYVGKQAGKVVTTGKRTISKDGKLMTLTGKSLTPQGQWIEFEAVFERN